MKNGTNFSLRVFWFWCPRCFNIRYIFTKEEHDLSFWIFVTRFEGWKERWRFASASHCKFRGNPTGRDRKLSLGMPDLCTAPARGTRDVYTAPARKFNELLSLCKYVLSQSLHRFLDATPWKESLSETFIYTKTNKATFTRMLHSSELLSIKRVLGNVSDLTCTVRSKVYFTIKNFKAGSSFNTAAFIHLSSYIWHNRIR